jgi:hypothetical protein
MLAARKKGNAYRIGSGWLGRVKRVRTKLLSASLESKKKKIFQSANNVDNEGTANVKIVDEDGIGVYFCQTE